MIQWFDTVLNKHLFSAALHVVCFKYSCTVKTGIAFCNSSLVDRVTAFSVRGPRFNPEARYTFLSADSSLLQFQRLLSALPAALIICCKSRAAYHFFFIGQ